MDKLKVLASGLIYPVTMMRYFTDTMEEMEDIELLIAGPFSGNYIPWNDGMTLPAKYVQTPYVALPMGMKQCDPIFVERKLPWKPDLWIQFDAGFHFSRRPDARVVATVGTDPHVLNDFYDEARRYSDFFFNMQLVYKKPKDIYLPYAFHQKYHRLLPVEKNYDGCLIGIHYKERDELVNALIKKGYGIVYRIGDIFEEFQLIYNESKVALNWPSRDDLNARTFEAAGMAIPLLTKRVTDLPCFFVENDHYMGFDTLPEAIDKFEWMMKHPLEIEMMAKNAHRKALAGHTYQHRVNQILHDCKMKG